MDKQFKDFLLYALERLLISLIDLVFLNRKDNIIDPGKHLKAFQINFDGMLKKLMTMLHVLIFVILCFPLDAF